MNRNKTGVWGEIYVARYLRDNSYKIISSNYSCRLGEIDLIAIKGNILHIIEVKTRGQNPLYSPALAVDLNKQRRIIATTQVFLKNTNINLPISFDVAEVTVNENDKLININYIDSAYER